MATGTEPVVRVAQDDDVGPICRFGEAHIPPHYAPLIGAEDAAAQVRDWWNETHIGAAVADGLVVVAETPGQLVGVGQRGRRGADHVVYKLYAHPEQRGPGLGPRLLAALSQQFPADVERLSIEHFAGNERAGRSTSGRASPWSGSIRVPRRTPHSRWCGEPDVRSDPCWAELPRRPAGVMRPSRPACPRG